MATVIYAQTWQVLTLKNCIEPLSYASTAYVVASYSPLFSSTVLSNLGNLQEFFGQMVYSPPWPKIARTPMLAHGRKCFGIGSRKNVLGTQGVLVDV